MAFVAVNAGLVAGGAWFWSNVYSVLADPLFVLLPMTVLAFPVAFGLHVLILRLRSHWARALAFYGAFVVLLIGYGVYLVQQSPERFAHPWPVVLVFGHALGLPVVFVAALANKLLSPVLCPRS